MKTLISRIWTNFSFVIIFTLISACFFLIVGFKTAGIDESKYEQYTIVESDNLWTIAENYASSTKEVQSMVQWMSENNDLINENKLEAGTKIYIPVKKQQTADEIMYANND
ncbi:cell division suppressor protein YneA [Brochothrix thermosphacta]|uniref:cell division suppressor protein YneA n=1 Tax=Brochothrix thermosphacta TaxID=2756 RepID=UPI0003E8C1A6|nr:LysM peptidoglycan-binding domain-containing protein [Brochothrix thermosphacta]EUJ34323.1 peptidoglycan-binding domain-containing protein [Brochothrix thermosphacta DSM 20171 = FSL F6-1036]ODJ51436.1 hypothetical protein BFR34_01040 [Brochothrix thermosphacta DSM 20171 = FSL F6-1036]